MTRIKAIFFDFDLTLADTRKGVFATYNYLYKLRNLLRHKKGLEEYFGRKVSENIGIIASNKREQKVLYKMFLKVFIHEIPYFKIYGQELLKYLKIKKIKIVILSNNSKKALKETCKYWKIPYDFLFGDEDMKKGEEKHQAIKRLIKKFGLTNEEVFYVGDHIHDILEAKKAKVKIISVTTGIFSKKELAKYEPYKIIKNLNEIKKSI